MLQNIRNCKMNENDKSAIRNFADAIIGFTCARKFIQQTHVPGVLHLRVAGETIHITGRLYTTQKLKKDRCRILISTITSNMPMSCGFVDAYSMSPGVMADKIELLIEKKTEELKKHMLNNVLQWWNTK